MAHSLTIDAGNPVLGIIIPDTRHLFALIEVSMVFVGQRRAYISAFFLLPPVQNRDREYKCSWPGWHILSWSFTLPALDEGKLDPSSNFWSVLLFPWLLSVHRITLLFAIYIGPIITIPDVVPQPSRLDPQKLK